MQCHLIVYSLNDFQWGLGHKFFLQTFLPGLLTRLGRGLNFASPKLMGKSFLWQGHTRTNKYAQTFQLRAFLREKITHNN